MATPAAVLQILVTAPTGAASAQLTKLDKGQHPLQGETRFEMWRHPNDATPMAMAAARLDEAIRTKKLVHNGDEGLRRHALNAVKKQVSGEKWRYDRPADAKGERRKKYPIDALIGVVMGHSTAVAEKEIASEPVVFWGKSR